MKERQTVDHELINFHKTFAEYQIIDVGVERPVTFSMRAEKTPDVANQNSNMMALHNGSRVFVRKDDILKIFTDRPALYSVRLASLVFGVENLKSSCMPDESNPKFTPLNNEILDSVISKKLPLAYIEHFHDDFFLHCSACNPSFQAAEQSCPKIDCDSLDETFLK